MLIIGAFEGHVDELSTDLLQLLQEVTQLEVVERQVLQNQLDLDTLTSMQDLVGNMGSTCNPMRDHMNKELILCIRDYFVYIQR